MEQSKPQFFKGFIISFLRFSECTFDTKEEGTFKDHVIENYPSNFELFFKCDELASRTSKD